MIDNSENYFSENSKGDGTSINKAIFHQQQHTQQQQKPTLFFTNNINTNYSSYILSSYSPLPEVVPQNLPSRINNPPSIHSPTGCSSYLSVFPEEVWKNMTVPSLHFTSNDVNFVELIGEGSFGEVVAICILFQL